MKTVVVYVHGLWLTGIEGGLLRKRLARELHAETHAFSYPSVSANITSNACALEKYLLRISADRLHLVAHSLGGLVVLKLFENATATLPPGRIVLLGSPLNGSRAARTLARSAFGRKILGLGVKEELLPERERRWAGQREVGVIAGKLSVGLGRLIGVRGSPSDGTVYVDETRLAGMAEHLVLRLGHAALPFSTTVAEQTAAFLSTGRFIR
jgi:pimeloyl-ACP methyl ester carboxylesterase